MQNNSFSDASFQFVCLFEEPRETNPSEANVGSRSYAKTHKQLLFSVLLVVKPSCRRQGRHQETVDFFRR